MKKICRRLSVKTIYSSICCFRQKSDKNHRICRDCETCINNENCSDDIKVTIKEDNIDVWWRMTPSENATSFRFN